MLARHAPVLLLFEDMHWADPTTLDVMSVVVDAAPGTAMMIVITHRPEFLAPWQGRGHVTAHSLTRLGKRQVMKIVESVTGGKSLPDVLLGEIVQKTDGVPLFVEELTKVVVEAGFLGGLGGSLHPAGSTVTVVGTEHAARLSGGEARPIGRGQERGSGCGRNRAGVLLRAPYRAFTP